MSSSNNYNKHLRVKGLSRKEKIYSYRRNRPLNKEEKVIFLLKVQKELFKDHMDAPERKSYSQLMQITVPQIEEKLIKYLNILSRI